MPVIARRHVSVGVALLWLASPASAQTPPPAAAPDPAALAAAPRARTAIRELELTGDGASPALALQLEDGFIAGLLRTGVHALDSVEVGRRLTAHPELEKCDTSVCLKRLGEVLEVPHVVSLKVEVTGNSYKMAARVFRTYGGVHAGVPMDARSRFCDVCTTAEARESMIRLAESVRGSLEESRLAEAALVDAPRERWQPYAGIAGGLVTLMAGVATFFSADSSGSRGLPALAGALMGAGFTVSVASVYLVVRDKRGAPGAPRGPTVGLAFRF